MSEPKRAIHIRIRDLRRQKALTQEELAEALGLSRQSINAMEAGRCLPSLPVAMQIASYFSVPLGAVFEIPSFSQVLQESVQDDTLSLTPWTPLREVREVIKELSMPTANIFQTESDIVVEMYLPGYSKEQLSLEVGDDFVTVAGESHEEHDDRDYFRREFVRNSFRRTIALPVPVQTGAAEAEMKEGVLSIRIPKIIEEKPKTTRIGIK